MFNLLGRIPKERFYIACSGGVDSMVLLDFLLKFPANKFSLLYMNHGTVHGQEAELFVREFADKHSLELIVGHLTREPTKKESPEEFWRNERYKFFDSIDGTILTAHHLNDAVETWIFSSLRGQSKLIPYRRNNCIRPFLTVSQKEILEWANAKNVKWIQDHSNDSLKYDRNYIRKELMPLVFRINPGIEKMIKKKLIKEWTLNSVGQSRRLIIA